MDAFHITAPAPDGNGAVRAMRAALESGGVPPEEMDYISAHGTSTPINDPIETRAIKEVFGERAYRIPISSIKSMVGHSAGGCGALEAAALALAIAEGVVPPTINSRPRPGVRPGLRPQRRARGWRSAPPSPTTSASGATTPASSCAG